MLSQQLLDHNEHFKSNVTSRKFSQVDVVLLFQGHQLVNHVVLVFIEEIPVDVFLHRYVEQVDEHELAVQSRVRLCLLVDLAHLDHQVLGHSVLQVSSELLSFFVRSRDLQRVDSAVLGLGDVDRLQVGRLFVDDFEQRLQT